MRDKKQDDPQTLVSTAWLAAHLNDPDLRILDASWYLPDAGRDPRAEYMAGHIPGARFFDIDEIADLRSDLPHMAPEPEKFIARMRAMGVGDGHQVVVYDGHGLFSAARVWWLFRLMGKSAVAVLDGGLPKWVAEGQPLEDLPPIPRDRHMTVQRQAGLVRDVTQVAAAAKLGDHEILDARSGPRFRGEEDEPRPGLRAGHIPGSKSVPWQSLLAPDNTLKSPADLRAVFAAAGVALEKPVITSCGSGVTAAIINLALEVIGHRNHALYDGSWAEWGMYPDLKWPPGRPEAGLIVKRGYLRHDHGVFGRGAGHQGLFFGGDLFTGGAAFFKGAQRLDLKGGKAGGAQHGHGFAHGLGLIAAGRIAQHRRPGGALGQAIIGAAADLNQQGKHGRRRLGGLVGLRGVFLGRHLGAPGGLGRGLRSRARHYQPSWWPLRWPSCARLWKDRRHQSCARSSG